MTENTKPKPQEKNPAAPKKLRQQQRIDVALGLRQQGRSYRDIARYMREQELVNAKYSVGLAYKDVQDGLQSLNENIVEKAENVCRLHVEMYWRMLGAYIPKALAGDTYALNSCMQIMARLEKLQGVEKLDAVREALGDLTVKVDFDAVRAQRWASVAQQLGDALSGVGFDQDNAGGGESTGGNDGH